MNRLASTVALLFLLLGPSLAVAEEPYREWFDFLVGTWQGKPPGTTEAVFRYSKQKTVLYGEMKDSQGNEVFITHGWDAGKKAVIFVWHDSDGGHVRQEYTTINSDVMSGLMYNAGPKGNATGNVVVRRVGQDEIRISTNIANRDGTITKEGLVLLRKKPNETDR